MATWNHGDKTAGSTVQFNGKSYVTRKDTGQTVYDTVAAAAADPGLATEIADIRKQLQSVSSGSGSGFGTVQFAGDTSSTYYYRRIKASTSNTVREEFETDVLAMSDGSVPSAAILMINCVNLNDNTFDSPDKARAMMMYEPPADSTAAVSCYINSRDGSGMSTSGMNVVTGTYIGNGEGGVNTSSGTSPYSVEADGQRINIGARPLRLSIYGDRSQQLTWNGGIFNSGKNRTDGILAFDWNVANTLSYLIDVDDTGFEVYHYSKSRVGSSKNGFRNPHVYGANTKDVVYTYIAEFPSGSLSTTSTGGTYGPGTQAIVPVHANGRAKLITHINKLAAGQVPDDCFLEMWVVGLMGGGGSVPDNNYANLLKRVETLEKTSTSVSGAVNIGTAGYHYTISPTTVRWGIKHTRVSHEFSEFTPLVDNLPEMKKPETGTEPGTIIENENGEKYILSFSSPQGYQASGWGKNNQPTYASGLAIRIE